MLAAYSGDDKYRNPSFSGTGAGGASVQEQGVQAYRSRGVQAQPKISICRKFGHRSFDIFLTVLIKKNTVLLWSLTEKNMQKRYSML